MRTRNARQLPGAIPTVDSGGSSAAAQLMALEVIRLYQTYAANPQADSFIFATTTDGDQKATQTVNQEQLNNKYPENMDHSGGANGQVAGEPNKLAKVSQPEDPVNGDGATVLVSQTPQDDEDPDDDVGLSAGAGAFTLFEGTEGDDVIEGNALANDIFGFGGDDTLFGLDGSDTISGGEGDDTIFGGNNGDFVFGGEGDDTLFGDEGNDFVRGGEDSDTVFGGAGNDILTGDYGNDFVFGDDGDDEIFDHLGNDEYTGGAGADTFFFAPFYPFTVIGGIGGGQDKVMDFELGVDTLFIANGFHEDSDDYLGLSFNEYMDQHVSGGGEAGVVIEWVGGLIRLPGIDKEDLTPWDIDII